jgi:hypothetical protein
MGVRDDDQRRGDDGSIRLQNVLVSGTKVGVVTGVAVIISLLVTRLLPAGPGHDLIFSVVVLGAGVLISLLPAHWAVRARRRVAGAARACGGTVVFMAIDIVLLRNAGRIHGRGMPSAEEHVVVSPDLVDARDVSGLDGAGHGGRHARESTTLAGIGMPAVIGAIVLAGGKAGQVPGRAAGLTGTGYGVPVCWRSSPGAQA